MLSFMLAESVLGALFTSIARRLKSVVCCLTSTLRRVTMRSDRLERAHALQLAALCVMHRKHEVTAEEILAQADEFLQYITGDDNAKIPRPDKATGSGGIPRLR